jgi:hypothetical protein
MLLNLHVEPHLNGEPLLIILRQLGSEVFDEPEAPRDVPAWQLDEASVEAPELYGHLVDQKRLYALLEFLDAFELGYDIALQVEDLLQLLLCDLNLVDFHQRQSPVFSTLCCSCIAISARIEPAFRYSAQAYSSRSRPKFDNDRLSISAAA